MLRISRLADYATVIMHTLGRLPKQSYSAAQVAQETQIASPTVSKVLKLLHEAQLVDSKRGVRGGYQLMRAPESITLAQIITAVDGRPALTECAKGKNACERDQTCELRHNWRTINTMVFSMLNTVTLSDMQRPLEKELPRASYKRTCFCDCHQLAFAAGHSTHEF